MVAVYTEVVYLFKNVKESAQCINCNHGLMQDKSQSPELTFTFVIVPTPALSSYAPLLLRSFDSILSSACFVVSQLNND